MKRKPLQVYLNEEERKKLDVLQEAMTCKTKSGTIKAAINLIFNLREAEQ